MLAKGYEADVAIITGNANEQYVRKYLLPLGDLMHDDEFWNDQIEQINVLPNGNVDLVMRVGNPLIHLGRPRISNANCATSARSTKRCCPKWDGTNTKKSPSPTKIR